MTVKFQPLDEYRKALRGFDWLYDYSDDYRVWAKGKAKYDELWDQARISDDHRQVWDEIMAERKAAQERRDAECRAGLKPGN